MKRMYKKWNNIEEKKLRAMVGSAPLQVIAQKLGRNIGGVERKLEKLGISTKDAQEDITAYQLATLLNVDSHSVLLWVNKHGLPHNRKITKFVKENIFINPEEFWKWAEKNRHRLNFAKVPRHALPREPEWVEEQRRIDHARIPSRSQQYWTPLEDQMLLSMVSKGITQKNIGIALNRPTRGVQKRLKVLREQKENKSTDKIETKKGEGTL